MFMPNLIPRDVHHIWLKTESTTNQEAATSTTSFSSSSQSQNQAARPNTQPQQRPTSFANYAPPLSSYSSERPGAILHSSLRSINESNSNYYGNIPDMVSTDVELRLRQLRSIRTLGFSYLAPLGIGKTMETLEEENMIKRQMSEQFQNEASTAENLLGEADNAGNNSNTENGAGAAQFRNQNNMNAVPDAQQQVQESQQLNFPPVQGHDQPETQETEVNLDDLISDAESYSNNYELDDENDLIVNDGETFESQYDRGFMVREQYDQYGAEDSGSGERGSSSESSNQRRNISHPMNTPQRSRGGFNTGAGANHVEFVTPSRSTSGSGDHHFGASSNFRHLSSSSSFHMANRMHEAIREEDEIEGSNENGDENDYGDDDHDMTFDE
ncbi:hypothetical protein WICPIJ_008241 [Wickerhamomyces pijperi]|uniref:Uncharacterized protein n=1 Tax=Wickerhamomyces pijperi TaxID=599730 RepID=A0A9P8PZS6_WICPI|nr:hypothetical protein WICPIJ_008241 [Wickerhamomyces pijperi]